MDDILTDADVLYMKETRAEVVSKRLRTVTVIYETAGKDEFTGEPTDVIKVLREVEAVVTELSGEAYRDKRLEGSISYEKGDLMLSVAIELIEDIAQMITEVIHDDVKYTIISRDKKGIGIRNRYELLVRRIS